MRVAVFAAFSVLALAACGQQGQAPAAPGAPAPAEPATPSGEPVQPPRPAPAGPTTLGGVDLAGEVNALGTEPFWGLEIRPSGLKLAGVDRPELRAPNSGPQVEGKTAVWKTSAQGGAPMTVTLTEERCSDGMSDRAYPLAAKVEVGPETLNGCAISYAELMSRDETGAPRR
ncbi:MAG TPA: hypothetical protein VD929_09555 [Caulobacteraceae bacterium]|nr:hypothetical protein [Caulobacteraceae bacterium]